VFIREIPNNKGYQIRPEAVKEISAHTGYTLKCAFSPDGRTLVTCSSDTTAKIWSTSTWQLKSSLEGHSQWVWDCCFSADSRALLTGSSDRTAILWELSSGAEYQKFFVAKHGGNDSTSNIGGGPISAVTLWDEPDRTN